MARLDILGLLMVSSVITKAISLPSLPMILAPRVPQLPLPSLLPAGLGGAPPPALAAVTLPAFLGAPATTLSAISFLPITITSAGLVVTSFKPITLPPGAPTSSAAAPDAPPATLTAPVVMMTSMVMVTETTTASVTSVLTNMVTETAPASLTSVPSTSAVAAALVMPTLSTKNSKGPFAPPTAELGGIPTKSLDIPVTVMFMILFIIGAVTHFKIHGNNGKRGHKFHCSTAMFDFCMVRTFTCILRIVWATLPDNASVELAALVFEFAGTVVVFLVNIYFTQRILRACHGNFGYLPAVNTFFLVLIFSVPVIIVYNITILVLSFFLTDKSALDALHYLLLFGSSWTLFLAFFPIPVITIATWIPGSRPVEKFGTGRFRNKIAILLFSAATLSIGGINRLLSLAIAERKDSPGWFNSKAIFYITGFTLELIIVYLYIFTRIDKRFHVPDGCTKAGDYAKGYPQHGWDPLGRNGDDAEKGFASDNSGIDGFGANGEGKNLAEIKIALDHINVSQDIVGYPVDMGVDTLLYVFKKNSGPKKPTRTGASIPTSPRIPPPPIPPMPGALGGWAGGNV